MKYMKWLILFIIIILTTGCWNYRELSELDIVSSIGIDVVDDEYNVSVEIVNSKVAAGTSQSGGSSGDQAPITVYQGKAKTIKQAMDNILLEIPHSLYAGHIKLLAIGEEAAKKSIYDYIDYFMADIEVRKIFPVVVVEGGKAIDLLKIILPLETVTGEHIEAALETESMIGSYISNRKFDEVINCLYMEGRHLTISAVKLTGEPEEGKNVDNISSTIPKSSMKITGSAVFRKDKLVGYLHKLDSMGYTIIRNTATTMDITFPCNDKGNYGTVVVDNVKTKLTVTLKNNEPNYEIKVTGKAAIPEYDCKVPSKDPEGGIKKVKKMVNKELNKIIDNTIIKLQKELKSDVIGFGERLFKEHNKYWKKRKKEWDDIFPNVKYKIKTDVTVESVDSTNKPAKEIQ